MCKRIILRENFYSNFQRLFLHTMRLTNEEKNTGEKRDEWKNRTDENTSNQILHFFRCERETAGGRGEGRRRRGPDRDEFVVPEGKGTIGHGWKRVVTQLVCQIIIQKNTQQEQKQERIGAFREETSAPEVGILLSVSL